jgi:nucleoside-diphosphate-sugar epimerase
VNPIGPRSVYDEAKRFSEAVTMAYHRYYKVDTRIVRICNTYGLGCNYTAMAVRRAASAMSAMRSTVSCG